MSDLEERDRRHVWHPFTQMSDWMDSHPIVIERGEGNYLIDTEGNRYLDGISSMWVNLHGHDHPKIRGAIHAQLDRLAHSTLLGLASVPSIEVAERLVGLAPEGLTRCFFSDNGSTAMEVALKLAFQYWQQRGDPDSVRRTRFVALRGAYHGDTLGAVSVGGITSFHDAFRPLTFPVLRAENSYCYRCPYGLEHPSCELHCTESLEKILARHGDEVAAVLVEPVIQAPAGMIPFPEGWLSRARALCDDAGTLLITDEVATGFGRTGRIFACEHEGVTPDLMALAKGMTAGFLPLAATLVSEEIFDAFLGPVQAGRQFFHGHSYSGNALACAATLANLEVFDEERVLERVARTSLHLGQRLAGLEALPCVGDVRRRGLMAGVELVRDRDTKAHFDPADRIAHLVCSAMRRRGVILRPLGDTVVVMPPLSVTEAEIDHLTGALAECIAEVTGT
ncbi:MAG: adenosylmethionine--8-amino-7-oxononanoate transaminase [Myxococcales bacterium]|nr:adenosylmethionine--8-amino-7-oxononanoate transaminase [Myxococcales bacterium]